MKLPTIEDWQRYEEAMVSWYNDMFTSIANFIFRKSSVFEETNERVEFLEQELAEVNEKNNIANGVISRLSDDIGVERKEKREAYQKITELEAQNADLEGRFFGSQIKIVRQEGEMGDLEKTNSELGIRNSELEQMVDNQRSAIEYLNSQLDQAEIERDRAEFDLNHEVVLTKQQKEEMAARLISLEDTVASKYAKLMLKRIKKADAKNAEDQLQVLFDELKAMEKVYLASRAAKVDAAIAKNKGIFHRAGHFLSRKVYTLTVVGYDETNKSEEVTDFQHVEIEFFDVGGRHGEKDFLQYANHPRKRVRLCDILDEDSFSLMHRYIMKLKQRRDSEFIDYFEFIRRDEKPIRLEVTGILGGRTKDQHGPVYLKLEEIDPLSGQEYQEFMGADILYAIPARLDDKNCEETCTVLEGYLQKDYDKVIVLDFANATGIPPKIEKALKDLLDDPNRDIYVINAESNPLTDVYACLKEIAENRIYYRKFGEEIPKKPIVKEGSAGELIPAPT